ncbi:helix-turn-helix domain-containing protein [Spirochaeta cellobiosiphila]|uniref:helix-turn-helix domain-containing protein n=1 Tax=Spirochaeta cellobiosiphila TaxID=504483 RepID=UPI000422114A|nr:AraC family transcriptional regulator [Spirochaeta cellobiosiphila]
MNSQQSIPLLKGEFDKISETFFKEVKIPNDYYTQLHRHSFFEIMLIKEGQMLHIINNKEQVVLPGTLILIRPRDIHRILPFHGNSCTLFNLEISTKVMEDLFSYLGPGFDRQTILDPPMPPTIHLSATQEGNLSEQITKIHYQHHWDKLRANLYLRNLIFDLVGLLYLPKTYDSDKPMWFNELLEQMIKPVNFRGGLKKMISLSGKSREHLSRSMKKYIGKTPSQFINSQKLNYSVNLLRYTDKSIIDISYESGFENPHYFYRLFSKEIGLSPGAFRKSSHEELLL